MNTGMDHPPVSFSLERLDAAALRDAWQDLERRADITFFLSWFWIGAWVELAGAPDFILVGRANGEIVCLGLLRRSVQWRHRFVRSRMLCLHETGNADQDALYTEYNRFLSDKRFGDLGPGAVAFLRGSREFGQFDELQIGGAVEADHDAIEAAGHKTQLYGRKSTAYVDLWAVREGDGEYLATVSANTRYQIRRALKIYESRGPLSLQPARTTEEALRFFDELGVLHEAAWQKRGRGGAWQYPFLVAFQKRLIETAFDAGAIDIVRISCGETPIGYIHCFVRDGWIGSYLSGFAYEEDNKIKPGLVSFYLYIEHRLKTGGEVFDFLAGDHRYKTSLGQPGATMLWFRVQERRPQLMLEEALRRVKQRVEAFRTKGATPAEGER